MSETSEKTTTRQWTFDSKGGLASRILILIYLFVLLLLMPVVIFVIWRVHNAQYFGSSHNLAIAKIYSVSFLSGICGGAAYSLRGFYQRHADRSLDLQLWWPWYLGRPILSGIFSSMVIALFNGGILVLEIKAKSGSTIVGLSFLIGLGFHEVYMKIHETIETLFRSNKKAKSPQQESAEKIADNSQRPLNM